MIEVLKMKRRDKPEETPGAFSSCLFLVVKGNRHDIDLLVKKLYEALRELGKEI